MQDIWVSDWNQLKLAMSVISLKNANVGVITDYVKTQPV
jgi:hypothetical protein